MADNDLDAEFKRAFIASERRKKWGCGCLVIFIIFGGMIYEFGRVTNQVASQDDLIALVPDCKSTPSVSCDKIDDLGENVWWNVPTDEGKQGPIVDIKNVKADGAGGVNVSAYTGGVGLAFDRRFLATWHFDCEGNITQTANFSFPIAQYPTLERIADKVCGNGSH